MKEGEEKALKEGIESNWGTFSHKNVVTKQWQKQKPSEIWLKKKKKNKSWFC